MSMSQGKLEVIKQEMTRVNIDILGIRELKQTGIGEFNAILGCNLRNERMISISFQGKPFSITVVQVYVPTSNTKKYILFITGDWNTKIGSQEIPGVTDKFDLGVQNEPRQRLTEFSQENPLVIANTLFQ